MTEFFGLAVPAFDLESEIKKMNSLNAIDYFVPDSSLMEGCKPQYLKFAIDTNICLTVGQFLIHFLNSKVEVKTQVEILNLLCEKVINLSRICFFYRYIL